MIKRLIFALLFSAQCHGFGVFFYDWQFLYFNSPEFVNACDAGIMDNDIAVIISKKIEDAAKSIQNKKGEDIVVVASLDSVEDMDPRLDVTSEVYQEMIGMK